MFNTFLEIALRNLVQARRRTLVLSAALALVTMLLVLLLALSAGLSETMIRSATILSTGHVNIGGFFKAKPTDVAPLVTDTARLRRLVREHVDGVSFVVDRGRGFSRIISPTTSIQVGLTGIDVTEEKAFTSNLRLAPVSEYVDGGPDEIEGDVARLAEPQTAMLFAAQARRLGMRVGDRFTVVAETVQGARNSTELTVVAVAKDIGFLSNFSIFVHEDALRQVYNVGPDVTGVIQIYLDDHTRSAQVMKKLRPVLREAGYEVLDHEPVPFFTKFSTIAGQEWTGQKVDVTTWEDEVLFLTWVLNAVDTVSFALVAILVVLIGIGVMNSMWVSVRERTGEVGTLRAIGMGRGQVLLMFLLEAVALGLFSTSVGALLGATLATGLDVLDWRIPSEAVKAILMSETLNLVVRPQQLLLAVAAFTGLCGFAALLPAYRASRLQPVTAIQLLG